MRVQQNRGGATRQRVPRPPVVPQAQDGGPHLVALGKYGASDGRQNARGPGGDASVSSDVPTLSPLWAGTADGGSLRLRLYCAGVVFHGESAQSRPWQFPP